MPHAESAVEVDVTPERAPDATASVAAPVASAAGFGVSGWERLLDKIGGATAEQLLPRTEAAFAGRHFWARLDVEARRLDDDRMNAWLDRWSPIIASQLARRPRHRPAEVYRRA